ncbi:MAG TPA: hypothetical protein VLH86_00635 [Patescibacteria group bacterium]|nr:hypothetical protein [Patescibacteria group bacterium]
MSTVQEVKNGLREVRETLDDAPYTSVAEALGKLTVSGVDEVRAAVEAAIQEIKDQDLPVRQIKLDGEVAFTHLTVIADVDTEGAAQPIEDALTHMEVMSGKAGDVHNGMGIMGTKLDEALGHLVAFTAAMEGYEAARLGAVDNLGESFQGQQAAHASLNEYEERIS